LRPVYVDGNASKAMQAPVTPNDGFKGLPEQKNVPSPATKLRAVNILNLGAILELITILVGRL